MLDELEALVGYVFVVGGRAVSATPPGALVQLPPRKPQRGREQDTFFTLVTAAGANQAQAAFYEQLARLAADLYFRTSGSVTSGLREAVSAVNSHLLEHNQVAGQRYEANMICMVLRGAEAYVARTGACLCLLRQGETFTSFPDDLKDEYALNGLPLGYSPAPDIKLSHYDVAPGHVMVLSDAGLAQADRDKLNAALGAGNVQAIIEPLKALGGSKAQAIVIEFVTVDTPDPALLTPQPGSKITRSSAAPAAAAVSELSATGSTPITLSTPAAPVAPPKSQSKPQPKSQPIKLPAKPSVEEALPPVQEIVTEATQSANRAGRKAVGGTASFLGAFARALNALINRILPEPEENGPHIPTMLAIGLAILVPVVIVFVVVAFKLSEVDLTQYERTVQEVQAVADQAETIPLTNVDQAKTAWLGVLQRIEAVEQSSGRRGDPTLTRIRARAQEVLDGFAKVTRRAVTPLRSFSDGAKLDGPILRGGTDLYTLDLNLSAIYRDTLNASSNSIMTRNAQPVVQRGQAVGANSVRQLIDIVWMPEGGVRGANLIAALDTQGILVTYSPTFAPATSQPLPGADRWVKPVAMTTWQGRLYILDADANQVWRYVPAGASYPNPPEEYFDDPKPVLKDAISLAIDTSGNVYILFANGVLKKFTSGTEQPFSFTGMPEGNLKSANAMYMDIDSPLPAIYITDPLDQSVYEFTLAGTFRYRFRSADPNAFRQLTGVYADRDNLYVASGPIIYYFSVSDLSQKATPVP
ncbi:MAG: hypothetical protein IT324_18150 [Anaerolineae bacterium]|nr:hypothetical protein [Anaerolineae bacterium]